MRKIFIILLAVLILTATVAVLPAAAWSQAEGTQSEFDGTTTADAEALDLVVTEFMSNTTCSVTVGSTDVKSRNAFQYIEVYNRGGNDINLYDLAIVRSKNVLSNDPWNTNHTFEAKLSLNPGSIYTGVYGVENNGTYSKHACINPTTAMLKPGEFAIIWFWNDQSRIVSNALGKSLGATTVVYDGAGGSKTVYHKAFRDHYKTQNNIDISDDLLVVAVYAGSTADSTNNPRFNLNTSGSYMYALVKDEASGANFDHKTESAFTVNRGSDTTIYQYNDKVVCLWQWGVWTNLSIPSGGVEGYASVYVPASSTPAFHNAMYREIRGESFTDYHNYYEMGHVDGFKEMALMSFREKPTIGAMEPFQWAYVDPDRAPASAKALASGGKTWQEMAISYYILANLYVGDDVPAHTEEKIDYSQVHAGTGATGSGQNTAPKSVQTENDTNTFNSAPQQVTPSVQNGAEALAANTQSEGSFILPFVAILFALCIACSAGYFCFRKKAN